MVSSPEQVNLYRSPVDWKISTTGENALLTNKTQRLAKRSRITEAQNRGLLRHVMRIENIQLDTNEIQAKLSVTICGEILWFKLPASYLNGTIGNALVASAFFPAMAPHHTNTRTAELTTLEIPSEYPVSPALTASLPFLRNVFQSWCPRLEQFTLKARETAYSSTQDRTPGIASMFSGGVDSVYTLLKHQEEISHIVYIAGFEHMQDTPTLARTTDYLTGFAKAYGKQLIVVETNQVEFFRNLKIGRYLNHGSSLAAVAHLLGFSKIYIPSSYPYNHLDPVGSHPLTDPAWSSDTVQLVYDGGAESRIEKIAYLDQHSDAMQKLLVCWEQPEINCCRCNKCLRTMIAMELLNIQSPKFPLPLTMSSIRGARFVATVDAQLFSENIESARAMANTRLVRAMAWAEASVHFKRALKNIARSLDDILLAGWLQKRNAKHSRNNEWLELPQPRR